MKKFKLLSAIAMAGLLGLSARAAVNNYDLVNIKLTALVQTNNTVKGDTTKFNVAKPYKVTNKEILKLISEEFTNVPANTITNGAQLAVDDFFDGEFEVVSNGTVILDDATDPLNETNDAYNLSIVTGNDVRTGSDTDTDTQFTETQHVLTVASLDYEDASGDNMVEVDGSATFSSKEKDISGVSDAYSESFKLSGVGNGSFGEASAVVTGTVSGAGKFNE